MTTISASRRGIGRTAAVVAISLVIIGAGVASLAFFGAGPGDRSSTTSSGTAGSVVMSLGQTPRLLGPGTRMNYTLVLIPGTGATGAATVTSDTPVGLTATINPDHVNLNGSEVALDFSMQGSESVVPGTYLVGIKVVWQGGSSNLTYDFRVVQHLVLLLGGSAGPGGFDPGSISAKVGETITWLSVDPGSDEYGGLRLLKIVELNQSSPTLSLFSVWAFTFTGAGTYHVQDVLNSNLVNDDLVVVS